MKVKMFGMRGDYTITVKRHGKVIQEENFHNLFTTGFISKLIYNHTAYFNYCQLGSGSTAPSSSDTALTSRLWGVAYSTHEIDNTSADGLSRTWKYTYKFPANSSYVGTIREVGLSHSNASPYPINTHALIVDAEGQPISINKTYIDEVIITAKITLTRPSWQSGQTWSFMSGPLSKSDLQSILVPAINNINKYVLLSADWCPEYRPAKPCQYTTLLAGLRYSNGTLMCSAEFSGDAMYYYYDSKSGEKFKDYVNSLLLGSCSSFSDNDPFHWVTPPYRLLLPNADVFPVTTLEGLALGTGDGSTVDFAPEVPVWLANTEIVYKNGSPLTRGVDYFVDNLGNVSKYWSVMLGNFVAEIDAKIVVNNQANIWGTDECSAESNTNYDINSPVVYADSPIILKYGTSFAFSNKVNYFVLGTWTANASIPAGAALVFYYSTDGGSTWTEFGRISHNSAGTAFADTTEHTLATPITGITHVKIALENTDTAAYVRMTARNGRFGYVGDYAIRFASAPADGDVLTIDINVDRPWKSPDTIIQWNPILSFGV